MARRRKRFPGRHRWNVRRSRNGWPNPARDRDRLPRLESRAATTPCWPNDGKIRSRLGSVSENVSLPARRTFDQPGDKSNEHPRWREQAVEHDEPEAKEKYPERPVVETHLRLLVSAHPVASSLGRITGSAFRDSIRRIARCAASSMARWVTSITGQPSRLWRSAAYSSSS
jgi:hypothetical protein